MPEEIGLPCEGHRVNFETQDQMTAKVILLSPNNKIPAIPDPIKLQA